MRTSADCPEMLCEDDGTPYGTECQGKEGHGGPHWAVLRGGIGTAVYAEMRPVRVTWQYEDGR